MTKVLITGATKGIGWAITEAFAAEGADVCLVARSKDGLLSDVHKLKQAFPNQEFLIFPADMGKAEDVEKLAAFVQDQWGKLDVLVNNAGIFRPAPFLEESDENIVQHLDVNVLGPYRLTKALLPLLLEQEKGHIFNMCSVASRQAFPDCAAYTTSKFALLGLTRSLRMDLQDKGVRVTAVMPGATYTASWDGSDIDPNRIMPPADVARAVVGGLSIGPEQCGGGDCVAAAEGRSLKSEVGSRKSESGSRNFLRVKHLQV